MKQYSIRLIDGQDLRQEIQNLATEKGIKAGVVVSAVGSVSRAHFRMPGAKTHKKWNEDLEIISITGTLSKDDLHLHISVSDINGNVYGGHMNTGCVVRTTAEVVILAFDDVEYKRLPDESTGYEELVIE